ncbi:hypothetical protein H4S03_004522 [Coemansia sp. S3946]|nr:hypothetical protein H4S03_004522 [Coemansia sp. S3946]
MTGVSTFDKRSTEGKALIEAKRVVQRQKLLTQRGYSINAKCREVSIGMSRLDLKDNRGPAPVFTEDKKAIMTTYTYSDTTYLSVRAFNNITTRWMASTEFTDLEGKMNELIKLYETLTADTPASKLGTVLTSKNIYYYNERKVSSYTFDKRSPEGVEFIKAKLVIKREKSSTQRTHNANAKHRDQRIDKSRQELQEEHQ